MTTEEAYRFIRNQFYQGNAWKKGIATIYVTRKGTSYSRFKSAVETVGGDVWKENDYQIRENVTKHEYTCEVYIPDWRDPEADIYFDKTY